MDNSLKNKEMGENDFKKWLENFWKKIIVTLSSALVILIITMAGGWLVIQRDVEVLKEEQKENLTKEDAIWYVKLIEEKDKSHKHRLDAIEKKVFGEIRGANIRESINSKKL